jgi:CO/xanthine dehydrogenase Mo-binding subunit
MKHSRRDFLKLGGGLIVSLQLPISVAATLSSSAESSSFSPNAFIRITKDSEVHFIMPRAEMGQGILTGLTTLIAEELDMQPAQINVTLAPVDKAFNNPNMNMQVTGGSTSMMAHYQPLREAAAITRKLLLQAAAQQLSAPEQQLECRDRQIYWQQNTYPFGDFVDLASTLPTPTDVVLKPASQFKLIGQYNARLDALAKSTGQAEFSLDVEIPDLYRAALKRCDVIGGTVKSVDSKAAENMPGVKQVVTIFNGVAVVAQSYWQARQALDALTIEWDYPALASVNSEQIEQQLKTALEQEEGEVAESTDFDGDPLAGAAKFIEADYYAPYLAHSTMEPMNCTAVVSADHCELWVATQGPDVSQQIAAEYTGIAKKHITVNSTMLGGGFGRRSNQDYVAETVSIAKASGLAVQLVWSREDDTRNDFYRPASMAHMKAAISESGMLQSWTAKRAGANIMPYMIDEAMGVMAPSFIPRGLVDWISKRSYGAFDGWIVDPSSVEGLFGDYESPHTEVRHVTVDPGLRVGFWRAVGNSGHAFIKESFADEIAQASNKDPLQWRLEHTANNPRLRKVIEIAAEKAGWGKAMKSGHFLGLASHFCFNTYVARLNTYVSLKATTTDQTKPLPQMINEHHGSGLAITGFIFSDDGSRKPALLGRGLSIEP